MTGGNGMSEDLYYEQKNELVNDFGIPAGLATTLLASRNISEIETVMAFLRNYGQYVNTNR